MLSENIQGINKQNLSVHFENTAAPQISFVFAYIRHVMSVVT